MALAATKLMVRIGSWRAMAAIVLAGAIVGTVAGQVAASELAATSVVQTGQADVNGRCNTQNPRYFQTVYEPSDQSYRLYLEGAVGTGGSGCAGKQYRLAMFAATSSTILDQWSGTMQGTSPQNLPNVAPSQVLDVNVAPTDKSIQALWLSVNP